MVEIDMKKIKTLFISHSSTLGGAENALLEIITNLNDRIDPYVVLPADGILARKIQAAGAKTFVIEYKHWLMPRISVLKLILYSPLHIIAAFRIAALMKRLGIDIVFTNTCTVISGALAARMCSKPHIWSVHEIIGMDISEFKAPLPRRLVFRIISVLSKRIIVNSYFVKNTFPEEDRGKITTVYNGLNTDMYVVNADERNALRKKYGVEIHDWVISVIGTICDRKGQREAVLAMLSILKKNPDTKLILAGFSVESQKDYEKGIRDIVAMYGLEKSVIFVGFMENVSEIYGISDCVLLPSASEPFGRVIVEAMLAGVPVIATRIGGIQEIIRNGYNGVLIESRTPEIIADALLFLLGAPEQRLRYVQEARKTAIERFGAKIMINNIEKILQEVFLEAE